VPDAATPQADGEKKTLRAAEQERPEIAREREAYRQQMSELPAERLVFLDESGVTTKMARTHARAPRGQRAYGSVPLGAWQRLTVLGALACDGLVATMSIEASTSTSVLLADLEQVPALNRARPDAILVMETCARIELRKCRSCLPGPGLDWCTCRGIRRSSTRSSLPGPR
jgi:hypothetical protein